MSSHHTFPQRDHDAFVSFIGDEETNNFTTGLFNRLNRVGISYFRDDNGEGVKEEKKDKRLEAISTPSFAIALVVLSKKYVQCSLCQEELVNIVKSECLVVIPIYYKNKGEVLQGANGNQEWTSALGKAQEISGYELSKLETNCARATGSGISEPLDIIVERLVKEIHSRYPHKVFGPFGGEGEKTWEWTSRNINGIDVCYANFIMSIKFTVDLETGPKPQDDGKGNFKVKLEDGEHITSFAGYFKKGKNGGIRINSLTFRTNKRILGPINRMKEEKNAEEEYFSVPSKAGRVIEFFGRSDHGFLESIGADVELHPEECYPVQPADLFWIISGDSERHKNVSKIIVEFDSSGEQIIPSIAFLYEEKDGESEKYGSKTVQHVKFCAFKPGGPGRHLTSISKSIGPFGGGKAWDDGKFDGVREIHLPSKLDMSCITFVYDDGSEDGKTVTHPERASCKDQEEKVILDYPLEYLIWISGHKKDDGSISELEFHSNKTKYAFGDPGNGKYFCSPSFGNRIIGFYGTWGKTLDSIGVCVEPIPHMHPFKIVRPIIEGPGGTPWDDGVHSNVIGYRVTVDKAKTIIESITFKYLDNGSEFEGSRHGGDKDKTDWVMLEFPEERLLAIKGYARIEAGQAIIHDLQIFTTSTDKTVHEHSSRANSNMPRGTEFAIPKASDPYRRIVGFFGRATTTCLNSIGARLEPYEITPNS